MARASTYTQLSLDHYAKIMGLNPVHFAGGFGSSIWPQEGCNDVWPQHPWQSSSLVSKEELARAISGAEEEIARLVGYFPAPRWVTQEVQQFVNPYRSYALFVRDAGNMVLNFSKVNQAGGVKLQLLGTSSVAYSDQDEDDWEEVATVSLSGMSDELDVETVRVVFANKAGKREWWVRPLQTVNLSSGVLTVTMDSWLLVRPELWEKRPTMQGFEPIDFSTSDNFVDTVEVWAEVLDDTIPGCTVLYDHPYMGAVPVNGNFRIVDPESGIVQPYRASCAPWVEEETACGGPIRYLKFNYQSGLFPQERTADGRVAEMEGWMAEAIAWVATARLFKPICTCSNVKEYVDFLRVDTSKASGREVRNMSVAALTNPLGTRQGEVQAWNRLVNAFGGIALGAIAI